MKIEEIHINYGFELFITFIELFWFYLITLIIHLNFYIYIFLDFLNF